MRIAQVVFLLVTSPAIAKPELPHEVTRNIDKDVSTVLQRAETPGATILVIRDGQVIYRKAIGLRDLDRKLPARMGTALV